jgi:hypothetical protein
MALVAGKGGQQKPTVEIKIAGHLWSSLFVPRTAPAPTHCTAPTSKILNALVMNEIVGEAGAEAPNIAMAHTTRYFQQLIVGSASPAVQLTAHGRWRAWGVGSLLPGFCSS